MFLENANLGRSKLVYFALTIICCYLGGGIGVALLNSLVDLSTNDKNSHLIIQLFPFLLILICLLLCVKFIHQRPLISLINASESIRISRIVFGFGIWLILCILSDIIYCYFSDIQLFDIAIPFLF